MVEITAICFARPGAPVAERKPRNYGDQHPTGKREIPKSGGQGHSTILKNTGARAAILT